MDKELQKIDEKIDKLAEAVASNTTQISALADVVMFMKDRVATKEDLEKLATKEDVGMKYKMLEGHMNVIEQKLDDHVEVQKDIPARVTALEVKAFAR